MSFSFSPKTVTDGLVFYLDAANIASYTSGSTIWNDISRSSLSGTLVNGPTFNSDKGGSVVFDGTNDYVSIPNNSSLQTLTSLTIEGIYKFSTVTGNKTLIHKKDSNWNLNNGFYVELQATSLVFVGTGGDFVNSGALNINNTGIFNLTVTVNDKTVNYYLNGSFVVTRTLVSSLVQNTNNMILNSFNGTTAYFSGNTYSVKIYNRALTATEILQNYNATKGRFGLL